MARASTRCSTRSRARGARSTTPSHAQRQLVADASHELRTPVTSLRTNIEVLLAGAASCPPTTARALLEDVRAETEELSALITDVIELARGDEPLSGVEEVQLDDARRRGRRARAAPAAAHDVRRRARADGRRGPARPARPRGRQPARQRRQVLARRAASSRSCCAAASSACATTGRASRRTSAPHVFDRFYRGATARGRPGSGLGLAIVRQVAETHGGSIAVQEAPAAARCSGCAWWAPAASAAGEPNRGNEETGERGDREGDASGQRRGPQERPERPVRRRRRRRGSSRRPPPRGARAASARGPIAARRERYRVMLRLAVVPAAARPAAPLLPGTAQAQSSDSRPGARPRQQRHHGLRRQRRALQARSADRQLGAGALARGRRRRAAGGAALRAVRRRRRARTGTAGRSSCTRAVARSPR